MFNRNKYFILVIFLLIIIPQFSFAAGLINPLGQGVTIAGVISRIIRALLGLSGSVSLLMFVWGGFQYLWSAGDEAKVKSGKSTLKNAALGLVIIFSAYMMVNTIIGALSM